jgi:hypothetical protein
MDLSWHLSQHSLQGKKGYEDLHRSSSRVLHNPIIPALNKLRQEAYKFKTRLGYMVRPCFKNKSSMEE